MSRIANEAISLMRGSTGSEVGNLQRFLIEQGYPDPAGRLLVADESYGPKTEYAVRSFQRTTALSVTGTLNRATRRAIGPLGFIPFVQAKSCSLRHPARRSIRAIVIHTMECQETSLTAAEDVADWFGGRTAFAPPKASAHFCVDQDSVVQCVRECDEAWHASQANPWSIGLEHAGFARQTAGDWEDQPSSAILLRSARLAAKLCRTHGIQPRKLSLTEIVSGGSGFCGHADVNAAYGNKAGHTDPGEHFPWPSYLSIVTENM